MYSLSQRANSIFATFVSVMMCVLSAVALTGPVLLYLYGKPTVSLQVGEVSVKLGRVGQIYDRTSPVSELGFIDFNLDAGKSSSHLIILLFTAKTILHALDLSSLFNWNTKQLFVYVLAEFETPSHDTNAVVIWDDIIQTPDRAVIKLKRQRGEYVVTDMLNKLSHKKARLSLHYNVIPHVGMLQWFTSDSVVHFEFPSRTS
ncbi:hypothetical protein SmJEL517_g00087 [Synchytrium microbalum]|uniref:Signal peptidase subunit 3 n=1 Tax=Synchytrium microbalum TaxID=1806994 RepID=A0A507CIS6_9FUNG|nr:uncharacterized protein SmJEL517_g00087 [Synchytrium microbalum]TPX38064.1 hypothetical protein SmJEL517_g00087 [Synchytrium microbalum]